MKACKCLNHRQFYLMMTRSCRDLLLVTVNIDLSASVNDIPSERLKADGYVVRACFSVEQGLYTW
jgi:hypothetical protein